MNFNLLDYTTKSNFSGQEELLLGLQKDGQKTIDPKFFYDEKGSKLFEQITNLIEYYPTKKEIEILEEQKDKISTRLPKNSVIIEFGSGSNQKIQKFIDALENPYEYIPIDISKKFLIKNAKKFAHEHPNLKVTAVCADFYKNNMSYLTKLKNKPNIGFFPGSTIGNFTPINAKKLLERFAFLLGINNFLVIGVDLNKDKEVIEKAYNDKSGLTAKFNKNVLSRINDSYGAKFDQDLFKHKAFFNEKKNRIEMHLESLKGHTVKFLDKEICFKKGETIHTENSYKYTINDFVNLSSSSGYTVVDILTDKKKFFGLFCLKVKKV